ncbi:hypothetical protein E4656_13590 [Natronospirillum operosum]|uniref:Uncharacterized protein n=1 Tax=Natronospirillum operosum TaxID=2759953 RepID=A0A4Z0WCH5_9GAMM|nr:hypothetical protein [Natronospirillum operosum]TGG92499.1 hypothetical protein E4656_13590 [Natronospirillum operosum]
MTDDKDHKKIKNNVTQMFGENIRKKKSAEPDRPNIGGSSNSMSGNSFNVGGNAQFHQGDIHHHAPKRVSVNFTPGPEHITPKQARDIQRTLDDLVRAEEAATGVPPAKLFPKWHRVVRDRYDVETYRAIPTHLGDDALAWLKQMKAIKRRDASAAGARVDHSRKELYTAIWARSKQLGLSKGDVYHEVKQRLGLQISSLTKLSDDHLQRLYDSIMSR